MANHKSALKKHRRDQKKRMINKINRSKMRNKIKLLKRELAENKLDEAKALFPNVMSIIDRTIIKGTLHKKTGSRYKSRLSLLMRRSGAEI